MLEKTVANDGEGCGVMRCWEGSLEWVVFFPLCHIQMGESGEMVPRTEVLKRCLLPHLEPGRRDVLVCYFEPCRLLIDVAYVL